MQREVGDLIGALNGPPMEIPGIVIALRNAGAAQHIVELVEHDILPALGQFFAGVGAAAQHFRKDGGLFRTAEGILGPAVVLLDLVFIGENAVISGHQLAGIGGGDLGSLRFEKFRGAGHPDGNIRTGLVGLVDGTNGLLGGGTAVIRHAVDQHEVVVAIRQPFPVQPDKFVGLVVVLANTVGIGTEGQDLAAVSGAPGKQLLFQRLLLRCGTGEHIVVQITFFQDLGQHGAMAEAVKIKDGGGPLSKVLHQIPLPVKTLADQTFAAGGVAVRLEPPALCRHIPTTLGHPLTDLLKKRRIRFPDPIKDRRRAEAVDKCTVLPHPLQSSPEGGPDPSHGLVPGPEPGGIEVGISDHIQGFHRLTSEKTELYCPCIVTQKR